MKKTVDFSSGVWYYNPRPVKTGQTSEKKLKKMKKVVDKAKTMW